MLISSANPDLCLAFAAVFFFAATKFVFYYCIKDVLPDQPGRRFICGSRQKISVHDGLYQDQRARKMRGIIMTKICKCPINGTVDGCSVNEQDQHGNHSMRVGDTKKERNLKAVAKRGKDDGGGRPRPRFGYIFGTNSGGTHCSWKWAVAKTGVNGRMQEQEETKE